MQNIERHYIFNNYEMPIPQIVKLIIEPLLEPEHLYLEEGGIVELVHELDALSLHHVAQDEPGPQPAPAPVNADPDEP